MTRITRREILAGGAALIGTAAAEEVIPISRAAVEVDKAEMIAPDVYFHEGNILQGHCNNGWIVFEDYVLVIDANFPSGAQVVLPKIRAVTNKPIRFAFDTHHHGDHAYGNQVWNENGATPVAHTGVVEEMKRYETGHYGGKPGRWEETAATRADVKASKLKPPSLLFPRELIFDDGKRRVELHHLGIAHTNGDAFAWLPKERILFTGDACVNGPYNFVGDGHIEKWIATLEAAKKLGARVICPGHGPRDAETLLGDQQAFFSALREKVGALVRAKKSPEQIRGSLEQIRAEIGANQRIKRYLAQGPGIVSFAGQAEKVLMEMTGKGFPAQQKTAQNDRRQHAHSHGLSITA
jgi:glyoxylase-like metal-dependent hydrolase (beta-lactamase superfamily II)